MRVLFASYHNYLDVASGAAISLRAVLRALARRGHSVATLCGTFFDRRDFDERALVGRLRALDPETRATRAVFPTDGKRVGVNLYRFRDEGIDSTTAVIGDAFSVDSRRNEIARESGKIFLSLLRKELDENPPDLYLSYGGYWAAYPSADFAREAGAKRVFYLCNFQYERVDLFRKFEEVVVPSQFARAYYRARLGVESRVLPPLMEESKYLASDLSREFITFINPAPEKGVFFFLGIARELRRLRPDAKILVVESRGKVDDFRALAARFQLDNLFFQTSLAQPKEIYRRTRLLLVPSLWNESFGRVAIESALNRIPYLCSNRGALPEVAGNAAPLCALPIPEAFTPASRIIPTARQVEPWINAILKILDERKYEQDLVERQFQAAQPYAPQNVERQTVDLFERLCPVNPNANV